MHISVPLSFIVALTMACLLPADAEPPPQQQQPQQQQQGGQRGQGQRRGLQRPARDASQIARTGTASISGRVIAADTGRPVKRARVIIAGGGGPMTTTTDDQGRYQIGGLPAATYNITATKSGFVDSAYGQRRALRAGTPLQLADGQQLANVDVKLPRGGVITGRIADEDGEPLARAAVSVMRYQYVRGERQLMPAGLDQTDDRGEYRVFGLPPGDYYVTATAGGAVEQIMRTLAESAAPLPAQATERVGYAPTYYPGVMTPTDATRLTVATGQEVGGIDFQVQLVPLAIVRGTVAGANAVVMLVPEGRTAGGGRGGRGGFEPAGGLLRGNQSLRAATLADGSFAIRNVPPGNYTIVARSEAGRGSSPRTAVQPLVVTGDEVQVALTPAPGVSVSGSITLEATAGTLPKGYGGFRVMPTPIGSSATLTRGGRGSLPNERGEFAMSDLMAGRYLVRATGPRGWTMKSVSIDGHELTDDMIEVKGHNISGVNVVFTDRISAVAGTVRDAGGAAAVNVTIVLFADDERLWYPQSRYINAARTNATGAFRINGLPAGRYFAAAIEDVEQGEWFEPAFLEQLKAGATRVTLGEGEQKTQDLKAPS